MNVEQTARLQAISRKAIEGTATPEELREGVSILRSDRVAASHASTTSRTAKAAAAKPLDTGALLADLKALGQKLASGPV